MDNDVKKTLRDQLVIKVNAIDIKIPSIIGSVSKTQFHSGK